MNKKILLTIAMVMVFISAIVVATTKDKNQERISDINDYSRAYINNRQARVNKEKENRDKLVEKVKRRCMLGEAQILPEKVLPATLIFFMKI